MNALPHTAARLFAAARPVGAFNLLLAASAWWQGGGWSAAHTVLALPLLYLHVRLDFDRRLFEDFAQGRLTPEDFDRCRSELGLGAAPAGRSMRSRCQSALKLWRGLIGLTLVQAVLAAAQAVCT